MAIGRSQRLFSYIVLAVAALAVAAPFLWMLSTSLQTGGETMSSPPTLVPAAAQWGNYVEAWTSIQFGMFFLNSGVVTVLCMLGTITSSFMVAYAFARLRFPGRDIMFMLCLSGLMMPVYVTIIPQFMMFRQVGWIDSLKPLIVPSYFGSAFGIFMLRQFIVTIPFELTNPLSLTAPLDGLYSHAYCYQTASPPLLRWRSLPFGVRGTAFWGR